MAHPEGMLISALLRSGDWKPVAEAGVTSDMFVMFPDEFAWIERFIERRGKLPDKAAFKLKFTDFKLLVVDDLDHYIEEIIEANAERHLLEGIDTTIDLIKRGNIRQAIQALQSGAVQADVALATAMSDDFDAFSSWEETFAGVEKRVERVIERGSAGVPTGWRSLDLLTGGMQPGWLGLIAARLGVGKTWTLTELAWAATEAGYNVLYFSLEQGRQQIAMRAHNFMAKKMKAKFKSQDLLRGHGFDLSEYREFMENMPNEANGNLWVNDQRRGRLTVNTIRAEIERKQPDLYIVDYMTLLTGNDWKDISDGSANLKIIAEEYQIPGWVANQLGRGGVGQNPGNEDVAGSDGPARDADLVLMVTEWKVPTVVRHKVTKFRHGPGAVSYFCDFRPGDGVYDEITGDRAEQIAEAGLDVD